MLEKRVLAIVAVVFLIGAVYANWFAGNVVTSNEPYKDSSNGVNTNQGADSGVNLQRGDLNKDGVVDQIDITYLLNYLFKGAAAPEPLEFADIDGDNLVSISDLTYLVNYVQNGGPAPVPLEDTPEVDYILGDVDNDGTISISDISYLVAYVYQNGPAPDPMASGDVNGDGVVDEEDVNYLTAYLFKGGPAPGAVETNNSMSECSVDADCSVGELCESSVCVKQGESTCLISAPFNCFDAKVSGNSLSFVLQNIGGNDYYLENVSVGECGVATIGGAPISSYFIGSGDSVLIFLDCSSKISEGDLSVSFHTSRESITQVSLGKIVLSSPILMKKGDVDGDGNVNIGDLTFLVNYLNNNGTAPNPLDLGDVNGDGRVDVDDLTYLTNYLFKGGPAPVPYSNQTSATCTDSDGGLDYYVAGTVTGSSGEFNDGCIDSSGASVDSCTSNCFVKENYCFGTEAGSMKIRCDGACQAGVCVDSSQTQKCSGAEIKAGDVNKDGNVNDADVNYMVSYLFKNGAPPEPLELADVNGDGSVNVGDLTYLVNYVTNNGAAPVSEGIQGPSVGAKVRIRETGIVKYCDPVSFELKSARVIGESCANDYECDSNACLDGECVSIKQELERQAGLLKKIWCKITHLGSSSGYDECIGVSDTQNGDVTQSNGVNTNLN